MRAAIRAAGNRQAMSTCRRRGRQSNRPTSLHPSFGQQLPVLRAIPLVKVFEDSRDNHRVLEAGDDPHSTAPPQAGQVSMLIRNTRYGEPPCNVGGYVYDSLTQVFDIPITGSSRVIVPSNPPPLLLPQQRRLRLKSNSVTSTGNVSSRMAATMSGASVVKLTMRLT
jgi:hypothetical protein